MKSLDEPTEQLVIDLAADYSERAVAGEAPSLKDYIDRLPDESSRTAFRRAARMTTFIANAQGISDAPSKAGRISATSIPHI
jgi:hypothetical protein